MRSLTLRISPTMTMPKTIIMNKTIKKMNEIALDGLCKIHIDMKKYIGTKQIEAEPMTRGDAWGKHLLREKPSTENFDDEGYHVRYEDGYDSWSPKDVFEKAYHVADTPLDRMYIEYNELMDKHNKLVLFLSRKDAVEIAGKKQVVLMERQEIQMHDYLITLKYRIDLMKK